MGYFCRHWMVLCKRKLKTGSLARGVISAYDSISDSPANHRRYQLKLLSLPTSVQCASSQTPLPKYIVALSFTYVGSIRWMSFWGFPISHCVYIGFHMSHLSLFGLITPTVLCLEHQLWGLFLYILILYMWCMMRNLSN